MVLTATLLSIIMTFLGLSNPEDIEKYDINEIEEIAVTIDETYGNGQTLDIEIN
mgnify:FL=1